MTANGMEGACDVVAYELLEAATTTESLGPFASRRRWDLRGHSGTEHSVELRSGMRLSASRCTWEHPLAITVNHVPSKLEFIASRGPGVRATLDGTTFQVGASTFQVMQMKRPVQLEWTSEGAGRDETVCLEVSEAQVNELWGTRALPASLARTLAQDGPFARDSQRMTPELFRLLDEVLHCDATGPSRRLYLEGKGLELLALMIDRFEEAEQAASPRLSQWDVDRLQRARGILIGRYRAPPRLPELAREVGLNEAKLKAGFRTLFGCSVFSYLRSHRMLEARRLLRETSYNVTEVALQVGYENPSKFAAAFRKQFGMSPSGIGA
jgi:AraC-like DNA-binding protein